MSSRAGPGAQPLADVLYAAARESSDLGALACTLQDTLSPLHATAGAGLQALDDMTQRLAGMANFLAALASGVPADWACDASTAGEVVSLSSLASRLTCERIDKERPNTGTLDLF